MKKFSLIFLNTLLLFFIINLVISFTWPTYSKFKSKKHQYIDEQVKVLNLSEENLDIFYNEMSENYHKFAYVPFIGHTETKRVGKFVNFDQLNGRKVIRPQNCNYNVYLYGGSTMFGYESIDKETIAQHLQNILGNTLHNTDITGNPVVLSDCKCVGAVADEKNDKLYCVFFLND